MGAAVILNETDFRKAVITAAKFLGFHVSHIEAHESAAGIPDLNIYPASIDSRRSRPELWLELKVIKDGHIKLRPTQRRWHRERNEAGGRSWVAALERSTGDVLILPGHVAAGLDSRAPSWRAAATIQNISETAESLVLNLIERNERAQQRSDSNGAPEGAGSPGTPLQAGGQNVGGDHWLLSDA